MAGAIVAARLAPQHVAAAPRVARRGRRARGASSRRLVGWLRIVESVAEVASPFAAPVLTRPDGVSSSTLGSFICARPVNRGGYQVVSHRLSLPLAFASQNQLNEDEKGSIVPEFLRVNKRHDCH